jgi:hypothetical protein
MQSPRMTTDWREEIETVAPLDSESTGHEALASLKAGIGKQRSEVLRRDAGRKLAENRK